MASVARLVGMELRQYEKDGQKRQFCGLHLVYLEGSNEDVMGSKVEETSCPRNVDPNSLEIGGLYELDYEIYKMRGQTMARLSNLIPVHEDPAIPDKSEKK